MFEMDGGHMQTQILENENNYVHKTLKMISIMKQVIANNLR